MRGAFFYFCRNYEPDLAYREMTENARDGHGSNCKRHHIYQFYCHAREKISIYSIFTVKTKKFGGSDKEVMVDFMKLNLRNKKNRNEEHLVLGFIDKTSGRSRGYVIPNRKPHTII